MQFAVVSNRCGSFYEHICRWTTGIRPNGSAGSRKAQELQDELVMIFAPELLTEPNSFFVLFCLNHYSYKNMSKGTTPTNGW